MVDFGSIAIGAIVGFIAGAMIFTSTGREVTRAGARRVVHHVSPRNNNNHRRRRR